MRQLLSVCAGVVGLAIASPAAADVEVPLTIVGNLATGHIVLPGGISADLGIGFESTTGLSSTSLRASVRLISPLDLGLLALLHGLRAPVTFPVLLRIRPRSGSTLSFSGITTVSLRTPNLTLNLSLPLSFYSSSNGEPFRDITTTEGIGSYRVSGSSGGFSDFVIVLDLQAIDTVIGEKFTALQGLLDDYAGSIPPAVLTDLQSLLTQAQTAWSSGSTTTAITHLTAFDAAVLAHSGADIPDVWRANDPSAVNVAGYLRAAAQTTSFSLSRKANASP